MQSAGQILRDERLRRSLTLEEVSASTRISLKNLDAIEKDELKQISSPFFYRSFARQFADRIGLDFSTISTAVESSASSMPRPLVPGEDGAPLPRVAALRRSRRSDLRWISSVSSLVMVVAGCSIVYALWHSSKSPTDQASLQQFVSKLENAWAQPAARSKPGHAFEAAVPRSNANRQFHQLAPARVAPEFSAREHSAPADVSGGFKIEVSALEQTWLSIVSDGKRIYSGVLEAEQSKILECHRSALIRTGNAGGVDVVFNGKEIGPLGPKGQIRTVVFTRDNYEIVRPSEHVILNGFELANFRRTVE